MIGPQKIWWHELNTWEPERAQDFYGTALGWKFERATLSDGSCYWIARKDGRAIGGIQELNSPSCDGIPSHWMTYMSVNDIQEAQQAAEQAGGEVMRPAALVPGIGRFSVVVDITGALIGLFEPDPLHAAAQFH